MLENLRRKSLTKTYNDPIHQVALELGYARYENHLSIDQCIDLYKQRFSKEKITKSLPNPFTQVSKLKLIPHSLGNVKFNMIVCPSGTFRMGSNKDQSDNKPRIEIIERPFLLGETEITQELYQAVMGYNISEFENPQKPVETVGWDDAIKFCNELSRLQGLDLCYTENPKSLDYGWDCDFTKNGYRLPKEKEWEYAAKAGTQNQWAGTNDESKLGEYAWFGENSNKSTQPVKTKKPNEWGFHDMSGNVSEWCWDKYNPRDDFLGDRVRRGGSWFSSKISDLRSALRGSDSPGYYESYLGFRVCRSIESSTE